MFYPLGTASNLAIQKYLNSRKVPQLFAGTAASKLTDIKNYPWTIGWQPTYRSEATIYANYILENHPNAKIGILYQNDDFGRDYLTGLRDVLGDRYSKLVVSEVGYEVGAPTVDSQVVRIRSDNPDVFLNLTTPKYAAQAIKKVAELGWTPVHIVSSVSFSVASVLKPAGLENSKGLLSANFKKSATDPQWQGDPKLKAYWEFIEGYLADVDRADEGPLNAYAVATGLIQVLKQAGDNLSRANIMRQAANLDFEIDEYLPGVRVKTSPADYNPIEQLQMMRFDGTRWERFGPMIEGSSSN
jgi:ABC-type branched-subunit amino acid transport system substrate-binding protein